MSTTIRPKVRPYTPYSPASLASPDLASSDSSALLFRPITPAFADGRMLISPPIHSPVGCFTPALIKSRKKAQPSTDDVVAIRVSNVTRQLTVGIKLCFHRIFPFEKNRSTFGEPCRKSNTIGSGGFGNVYKIDRLDKKTSKIGTFAVKKLKLERRYFIQEQQNCQILTELATAQRSDPKNNVIPHIVPLITYFEGGLVFPYISGGDLSQRIKKVPPLSLKNICSIISQFLETLVFFEDNGFIHTDLKPNNLMFNDSTEELFVIDLGLGVFVKILENVESARLLQIRHYRAPEELLGIEINGKRLRTPAMDMWSFGCILYSIITGYRLFESEGEDFNVDHNHRRLNPRVIHEHLGYISQFLSNRHFPEGYFKNLYRFFRGSEKAGNVVRSFHEGIDLKGFFITNEEDLLEGSLKPFHPVKLKEFRQQQFFEQGPEGLFFSLQDRMPKRVPMPESFKNQAICRTIVQIFIGCLNPNPRERITAFQALSHWNGVIGKNPPTIKEPIRL